jgi:hypothetical protein
MTPEVAAVRATGTSAAGAPYRVSLDTPGASRQVIAARGIYLAYTAAGELHDIGKVDRSGQRGAAARLAEHLSASRRKRTVWKWLWIVPVANEMRPSDLVGLERALILACRPVGNIQRAPAA